MAFSTSFREEKTGFQPTMLRSITDPSEEEIFNGYGCFKPKLQCPASITKVKVEKIEGGLMVAGVVIAANCQVALPAFGFLFIIAGAVLTATSYRGPGEDEDKDSYAARIAFTGNSRLLGPICIIIGGLMLVLGLLLCMLTRRARKRDRRVGFHCPLHGDFYPSGPFQGLKLQADGKDSSRWSSIACCKRRDKTEAKILMESQIGAVQCPHSILGSSRNSISSSPLSPCPTPMPFLVTSSSLSSGMIQSVGANMAPIQTFGSIRSLSVSREVASFPLSRTPTPPAQRRFEELNNPDEIGVCIPHCETLPVSEFCSIAPSHQLPSALLTNFSGTNRSSQKSVSILLPEHSIG